jgi:hypothetical protein
MNFLFFDAESMIVNFSGTSRVKFETGIDLPALLMSGI